MFSMEHCGSDSVVGAGKGVGVLCILVLRFSEVQPSLQPQQVFKPVGMASSGETPGLRTASGGRAAVPFVHPQLRGCRALPANVVSDPNLSSGPGPKAVGYLVHVEHTSHPHLPWALQGFVLGALRDLGAKSPSNAHGLFLNHVNHFC